MPKFFVPNELILCARSDSLSALSTAVYAAQFTITFILFLSINF